MRDLLERLMADVFGGRGVCFVRLRGGAGGRVFRVDFESAEGARSVCVKPARPPSYYSAAGFLV